MKYSKMWIFVVALLVLGAGSAEAQECVAGAKSANVRAEGETEMVGAITLKCRGPRARGADDTLTLGTGAVEKLEITVTLNTDITNARDTNDMIANQATAPGYREGNVMLAAVTLGADQEPTTTSVLDNDANNGGLSLTGDVSDDLRKVTWKHTDSDGNEDGVQFAAAFFGLLATGSE